MAIGNVSKSNYYCGLIMSCVYTFAFGLKSYVKITSSKPSFNILLKRLRYASLFVPSIELR
jgi:hypothetical protein